MRNNRMRTLFLVTLFLAGGLFSLAAETVTVITEAWPPYVFEEEGEAAGVDYDVMMAVFKEMGISVDFEFYPWNRCIEMLKQKRADAILGIGLNDERKTFLYYPREPVSLSANVLLYARGSGSDAASLADIAGTRVGVSPGYSYSDDFDAADNFTRDEAQSFEAHIRKLLVGRIDYFMVDEAVGLYKANWLGVGDKVAVSTLRYPGTGNFVGFSQKRGNKDLAARFSAALVEFKKTAEYQEILAAYGQ